MEVDVWLFFIPALASTCSKDGIAEFVHIWFHVVGLLYFYFFLRFPESTSSPFLGRILLFVPVCSVLLVLAVLFSRVFVCVFVLVKRRPPTRRTSNWSRPLRIDDDDDDDIRSCCRRTSSLCPHTHANVTPEASRSDTHTKTHTNTQHSRHEQTNKPQPTNICARTRSRLSRNRRPIFAYLLRGRCCCAVGCSFAANAIEI